MWLMATMPCLALGERHAVADTILALRPHAQVLLVSGDQEDLTEVLDGAARLTVSTPPVADGAPSATGGGTRMAHE